MISWIIYIIAHLFLSNNIFDPVDYIFFNLIFFIVFVLLRYTLRNIRFNEYFDEANQLIDKKRALSVNYQSSKIERKDNKDWVSKFTTGFALGAWWADGGITGLVAKGAGKAFNLKYDYLNYQDESAIEDLDLEINSYKDLIEQEDRQYYIAVIISFLYTTGSLGYFYL